MLGARRAAFVLTVLLTCVGVRPAAASSAFDEARAADVAFDFARALAAYDRVAAGAGDAAEVDEARRRAASLRAHAEGDFAPLARLERVRRDPRASASGQELLSLARDAASFPPGLVRLEARILAATGLVRRAGHPREGAAVARLVADDTSVDVGARAEAAALLVTAAEAEGDDARARQTALAYESLAPGLAAHARALRRWQWGRAASVCALLAVYLVAAGAWLMRGRSATAGLLRGRARAVATGVVIVVAGTSLGRSFDASLDPMPFVLLGAGLVTVDTSVALVCRAGAGARGVRGLALVAGLFGVGAVAFLALAWRRPTYLEGSLW